MLINVLCFVFGVACTVVALLVWSWLLGMKDRVRRAETARQDMEDAVKHFEEEQKAAQEILQKTIDSVIKRRTTPQEASTPPAVGELSVKDRLKQAVEITSKQVKIDTRKGPESVMQYNELELEKFNVLKTILAEGFDPLITIRYNTGEQEMLLSAYVKSIAKGLA